jgi:aspartokinase/homoserine dehydrogenase 1
LFFVRNTKETRKMRIMKFGGTSLQDAQAIARVRDLIVAAYRREPVERLRSSHSHPVAVVVSAIGGVTDQLLEAAASALTSYDRTTEIWAALQTRHLQLIEELLPADQRSEVTGEVKSLFAKLRDVLHGVRLVRECSLSSRDLIVSFGERLSARIVTAVLHQAGVDSAYTDARSLVLTMGRPGAAVVCIDESYQRIRQALLPARRLWVITGYIAGNREGVTTTLGRNGSDYSASLFGAALGADEIEIWTDVDGIFTADPRLITGSRTIARMTFEEAQEMAYFGASIVHPQALQPASELAIPVIVRNTFNPEHPGTQISCSNGEGAHAPPVRGMTAIDGVALVNVEGSGMIGVPGIAGRLFTALAEHEVNIIMISQASSEHSICFVTRREELATAVEVAKKTFAAELAARLVQRVEQLDHLTVLSVVGSRMRGTVGLSGRLFGALGQVGVNVLAISQGSSERNISIVVASGDKLAALGAVHSAFALDQLPDMATPDNQVPASRPLPPARSRFAPAGGM